MKTQNIPNVVRRFRDILGATYRGSVVDIRKGILGFGKVKIDLAFEGGHVYIDASRRTARWAVENAIKGFAENPHLCATRDGDGEWAFSVGEPIVDGRVRPYNAREEAERNLAKLRMRQCLIAISAAI